MIAPSHDLLDSSKASHAACLLVINTCRHGGFWSCQLLQLLYAANFVHVSKGGLMIMVRNALGKHQHI